MLNSVSAVQILLYRKVRMVKKQAKIALLQVRTVDEARYGKEYTILIGKTKESESQIRVKGWIILRILERCRYTTE